MPDNAGAAQAVDPVRLDALLATVRNEVTTGRLPSAQIAVGLDGELVASEVYGDATASTRYRLQSAGRPMVAAALWKVVDEHAIDVTLPVTTWIADFPTGVTVEQVVTHSAGLAYAPLGAKRMGTRESRLAAMARWVPNPETLGRLQFHLTSTGWVIWEIVECVTGLSLPEYLTQNTFGPLGLTAQLAVPVEEQGDVAPMVLIGDATGELDPWGPWYLDPPEVLAMGEPSHSVVATAADVALHYQGLLHSDVWSRRAVEEGTRVRLHEPAYGPIEHGGSTYPISMAMFVTVRGDSWQQGWVPATGSPSTFGHGGAALQQTFCDPATGLSFAFLTNGYPSSGYALDRWGKNLSELILTQAGALIP